MVVVAMKDVAPKSAQEREGPPDTAGIEVSARARLQNDLAIRLSERLDEGGVLRHPVQDQIVAPTVPMASLNDREESPPFRVCRLRATGPAMNHRNWSIHAASHSLLQKRDIPLMIRSSGSCLDSTSKPVMGQPLRQSGFACSLTSLPVLCRHKHLTTLKPTPGLREGANGVETYTDVDFHRGCPPGGYERQNRGDIPTTSYPKPVA
jgi:hypothetical protein